MAGGGLGVECPAVRPLSVAPLVSPNMRVVKDRAHALRVAVPRGWYLGRVSLTPTLAPPASILAAATFPPRADRRRACGLWPDMPQVEIGPKDALVHVGEELDAQPGRLPLRPAASGCWSRCAGPGSTNR